MIEYQIISDYYGDGIAKRSGVRLMNHIDEGLVVLDLIGASDVAKRAYCLHPILQGDDELLRNQNLHFDGVSQGVLITAMEYRSVANEYLSKREISDLDEIRLSPLKDVNEMLIADKIQNKKDFMTYHYGVHKRSEELLDYFNKWLAKLGIGDGFYEYAIRIISKKDEIKTNI